MWTSVLFFLFVLDALLRLELLRFEVVEVWGCWTNEQKSGPFVSKKKLPTVIVGHIFYWNAPTRNEDSDTLSTVFALFQVPLWSLLLYPPPPTRSLVPPLPPPPPPNCRLLPLPPPLPPPLSHLPHPPSQQPPPSSPCMDPLSAAAPTPLRSTPSTPTKVRLSRLVQKLLLTWRHFVLCNVSTRGVTRYCR